MNNVMNIVPIKNVVFTKENSFSADTKLFRQRPCIIICEDDEYSYMMPLSSHFDRTNYFNFKLTNKDIYYYDHLERMDSFVKVSSLFKKNLCFHEIFGTVYDDKYCELIDYILDNIDELKRNKMNGFLFSEIEESLYRQKAKIERTQERVQKYIENELGKTRIRKRKVKKDK